ncbi:MAG: ABC transporter permease [Thermotogota bacterium]
MSRRRSHANDEIRRIPDSTNDANVGMPASHGSFHLMWRKFRRHKLAIAGGVLLAALLIGVIFAPFFAPYAADQGNLRYSYCPPQRIHFIDSDGRFHFRPFTYRIVKETDPVTLRLRYSEDKSVAYPIRFFARGWNYTVFGFIKTNLHLAQASEGGTLYLFGTDQHGRDLWSRILFGGRLTLLIAIGAGFLSGLFGAMVGTVSGYLSGAPDAVIQRFIEVLLCFPALPLWMALSAALPRNWDPINTIYAITLIFALLGWPGIAREVRGKVLALREEEYVTAARAIGVGRGRIIFRHVLPQAMSHIIVSITTAVPGLMIGESTLSFLGLGVQPPMATWGALLQKAQNIQTLAQQQWLLIPGLFIMITVLALSFLGDGLRDAADPFSRF